MENVGPVSRVCGSGTCRKYRVWKTGGLGGKHAFWWKTGVQRKTFLVENMESALVENTGCGKQGVWVGNTPSGGKQGSSGKHSWWKTWSLVENAGSACDHVVFSHGMYQIYNNTKGRELL